MKKQDMNKHQREDEREGGRKEADRNSRYWPLK